MKGLLFREFYLARKYYLLSAAMFFLVALMSILVNLSMICGNLSRLSEDSLFQINDNAVTILTILPCLVVFISFCTDGGVTFSDYETNWIKYSFTTPLLEKQTVKVKFTANIISMAAAFVLSLCYLIILGGVTGSGISFNDFKNLLILLTFAIIISCLFLAFSIRYKNKNAVALRLIGIAAAVYIPCMAYVYYLMSNAENDDIFESVIISGIEKIKSIVFPIAPLLMIAGVAACYLFSVHSLRRREN